MGLRANAAGMEMMGDVMAESHLRPKTKAEAAHNDDVMMKHGMIFADKMGDMEKSMIGNLGPRNMIKIDPAVLSRQIRTIGERGYMGEWDFGWLKDPLVQGAFAKPVKVTKADACEG